MQKWTTEKLYISAKKYTLSIKKIEMTCKYELVSGSNSLDIVIQYKAKIKLETSILY